MLRNTFALTALCTAMLAITGCSSNSDSRDDDDDGTTTSSGVEFSGKVADGYLAGARVCLDLNSNNACDDDEPSTVSASGGAFTLEGVTQEQLESSPIVVEIIVGETVDEDEPGVAITKTYTLSAPAGSAFVSPLTTMIQNEIKENGLTPDEAKANIKARLGTEVDPSADYVAGASDEGNAAEYARLHKVAQVTRAVMQQNRELVEEVVGETGVSEDDLMAMIIKQVLEALDDIKTAVDNAGEGFDPDDLAGSDDLAGTRLDPSKIEDEIQQREDAKNAVAANLGALISSGGGLFFFESEEDYDTEAWLYRYGHVTADGETGEISVSSFFYDASSEEGGWMPELNEAPTQDCFLSSGEWACVNEDEETITASGNRIRILRGGLAVTEEFIDGTEVDLNGKTITSYLQETAYPLAMMQGMPFLEDSKGYRLTMTRTNTLYSLYKENTQQDFCGENPIDPEGYYDYSDNWCNNVWISAGETAGSAATALADLVTTTAVQNPQLNGDVLGIDLYGDYKHWVVELVSPGVARYLSREFDIETDSYVAELKAVGSWSYQTVSTKTLLVLPLPTEIRAELDEERDVESLFYSVVDGYVRQGRVVKAGTMNDKQWVFNTTAADRILSYFNESLQYPLTLCNSANLEDTATITDLEDALDGCGDGALMSMLDLGGMKLKIDDGVFEFNANGSGVYTGRVNDSYGKLNFTWTNPEGENALQINATSTNAAGQTVHMRLTAGVVSSNDRTLSMVTFSQEESSAEALDAEGATGDLHAETWEFR